MSPRTSGDVAATDLARIVVRPIGTPLPLGFLGLVVATLGFSALQLDWIPASEGGAVALGVLALAVPVQLIAASFGFVARDPVAGTGMAVQAGAWAATASITLTSPPGATSAGLGVLLLAAAAAMVVPVVAGATKLVAAGVMGLTALRFALTGAAEITGSAGWMTAAGVTGLLVAAAALYAALGFELEAARGRTVLPLLRRGSGADALTVPVEDELGELSHEAGVRKQL